MIENRSRLRKTFITGLIVGGVLGSIGLMVAVLLTGGFSANPPGIDIMTTSATWHAFPENSVRTSLVDSPPENQAPAEASTVRNVILFIGDGLGVGSMATGSLLAHGPSGGLSIERAPHTALVRTTALDRLVTDSGAGGTALATGFKANYKSIATLPDGRRVRSWFDAAAARGMAAGVITTSGLFDATPASFVSHAPHRDRYGLILEGMVRSEATLLVGGDWYLERDAEHDRDKAQALASLAKAQESGWSVVRNTDDLLSATGDRILALLPERSHQPDAYGPLLHQSTKWAIERLSADADGFALLVESEVTDEAAHDLDLETLLEGIRELDAAVAVALKFAAGRDDTLVLVTADHDTGGVGVTDSRDGSARVRWLIDEHTAQWVPLFAFGSGSGRFRGVLENIEVAGLIADSLALEGFPAYLDKSNASDSK